MLRETLVLKASCPPWAAPSGTGGEQPSRTATLAGLRLSGPVGIRIPVLSKLWPRVEESNPHPEGAPVLETGGGPSAGTRGGAPGENRTHHELLCRQPLRQLASGATWLAGDQGFEPCRNGFGVRRSSCRVMPPVVCAAGLEPAREPGLGRAPLPTWRRAAFLAAPPPRWGPPRPPTRRGGGFWPGRLYRLGYARMVPAVGFEPTN